MNLDMVKFEPEDFEAIEEIIDDSMVELISEIRQKLIDREVVSESMPSVVIAGTVMFCVQLALYYRIDPVLGYTPTTSEHVQFNALCQQTSQAAIGLVEEWNENAKAEDPNDESTRIH